jgi:hypothetical protein
MNGKQFSNPCADANTTNILVNYEVNSTSCSFYLDTSCGNFIKKNYTLYAKNPHVIRPVRKYPLIFDTFFMRFYIVRLKVKGKIHPRTGYEGPEWE